MKRPYIAWVASEKNNNNEIKKTKGHMHSTYNLYLYYNILFGLSYCKERLIRTSQLKRRKKLWNEMKWVKNIFFFY